MSTIKENEAILLYAVLKGYKFNVGKIIETSIRTVHKIMKRGLIPHTTTITRLCILAGVKGIWAEEETCPKVSSLTLTGVIKGPKSKKKEGDGNYGSSRGALGRRRRTSRDGTNPRWGPTAI